MRLPITKLMQNTPHVFLSNSSFRTRGASIMIPDSLLYYLTTHLKFSSSSSSTQLIEIFAYDNPISSVDNSNFSKNSGTTLVYQFHNLFHQERLFVFVSNLRSAAVCAPKTIGDLFFSSIWLEREVNEMHGICFDKKKDLRNLMLQYGDASAPFRKSYPSIGTKEIVFDSVTDTLTQNSLSLQA